MKNDLEQIAELLCDRTVMLTTEEVAARIADEWRARDPKMTLAQALDQAYVQDAFASDVGKDAKRTRSDFQAILPGLIEPVVIEPSRDSSSTDK